MTEQTTTRWRYVAHGDMGHIWHDTTTGRYVISDAQGPEGIPAEGAGARRGARACNYQRQFNEARK